MQIPNINFRCNLEWGMHGKKRYSNIDYFHIFFAHLPTNSSTTTGLRWQPNYSAGKNAVINGGFDIWQRGTSVSGAGGGAYTADRWFLFAGGQITVSRQLTNDSTNLPFIQYCARVQRNSGSSDTTNFSFSQSFETVNSVQFAGRPITFSFYARRGANYSSSANSLGVLLTSGTGTDQNKITAGYTGNVDIVNTSVTLTTTWQRFSFTGTVSSTANELCPFFSMTPTGTAGAADFFEVTGIQVEIGSVATPFTRNGATLAGELSACERYYYRSGGDSVFQSYASGQAISTSAGYYTFIHPTTMRVAPTSFDYSNINLLNGSGSLSGAVTSATLTGAGKSSSLVQLVSTTAALTAGQGSQVLANNTTSSYIAFNAEL